MPPKNPKQQPTKKQEKGKPSLAKQQPKNQAKSPPKQQEKKQTQGQKGKKKPEPVVEEPPPPPEPVRKKLIIRRQVQSARPRIGQQNIKQIEIQEDEEMLKNPRLKMVVAKKVGQKPIYEIPYPGTLEWDYASQHTNKNFLIHDHRVEFKNSHGPRFDLEGKVLPRSIVGPTSIFEKKLYEHCPEIIYSPTSVTTQHLVGEDAVENKIKMINQGQQVEKQLIQDKIQNLNVSAKIRETSQERILQNYQQAKNKWDNVQNKLQKYSGRHKTDLAFNRDLYARMRQEDRQILEEGIDRIKRRGFAYNFVQDLRQYDQQGILSNREVYYHHHGMTAHKILRPATATPFVRSIPMAGKIDNRENTHNIYDKNYKSGEYFQQAQSALQENKLLRKSPIEQDASKLTLSGHNKYQREIEAAQNVGFNYITPDLIENFSNSQKEKMISELDEQHQDHSVFANLVRKGPKQDEIFIQQFDKEKILS